MASSPSASLYASEETPNTQYRKFFVAPDADLSGPNPSAEIAAVWSSASIPLLHASRSGNNPSQLAHASTVPLKFPYPPTDLAWCPFKQGAEDSCLLVAMRSQPLKLIDTSDGDVRASYCALSAAGAPAYASSVLWLPQSQSVPRNGVESVQPGSPGVDIVAGYGGTSEDHCHLRFFDVLRDGFHAVLSYTSPVARQHRGPTIVSVISQTGCGPHLVAYGCLNRSEIEVMDLRHSCPAVVCRGLSASHGVGAIKPHPSAEFLLYASGRYGEDRIVCWDLRYAREPVLQFRRRICTNQLVGFDFVHQNSFPDVSVDASQSKWLLVSGTHGAPSGSQAGREGEGERLSGGILVFPSIPAGTAYSTGPGALSLSSSSTCVDVNGVHRFQETLHSTSAITALWDGTFLAASGSRCFSRLRDRYEENDEHEKGSAAEGKSVDESVSAGSDSSVSSPSMVIGLSMKRKRPPLDGDDALDKLVERDFGTESIVRCQPSVLVCDFPKARLITLNRPRELNAMSLEMLHLLGQHLKTEPHADPNAVYVFRGAGEKSFCAGGDLKMLTGTGSPAEKSSFFYDEYTVDYFVSQMQQPTVSLLNGFVMGSGVGLSIHTKHKVATEKTVFSMPETTLGSFPDISSSYVFTHLKMGGVGPYLGLTGARLKGSDLVHAGLATHFVPGSSIDALEEELCNIADPASVADCLAARATKDLPAFSLEKHMPLIERVFTLKESTTVEGIVDALKSDGSDFAASLASHLESCSPTSLKIELELLKRGSVCTNLFDAYKMEFVLFRNILEKNDFKEGVRALLIDKTKDPKWNPSTLEGVTDEYVRSFFESSHAEWNPEKPFIIS